MKRTDAWRDGSLTSVSIIRAFEGAQNYTGIERQHEFSIQGRIRNDESGNMFYTALEDIERPRRDENMPNSPEFLFDRCVFRSLYRRDICGEFAVGDIFFEAGV